MLLAADRGLGHARRAFEPSRRRLARRGICDWAAASPSSPIDEPAAGEGEGGEPGRRLEDARCDMGAPQIRGRWGVGQEVLVMG